jgi:hypothetical protein
MLVLISRDIGSATSESYSCGFSGGFIEVHLSSGFALIVLLFLFSIVQAALYFAYDAENDDTLCLRKRTAGGTEASEVHAHEERARAETVGSTVNPLYKPNTTVFKSGNNSTDFSLEAVIDALPENTPPPGFDGDSRCSYVSERGGGQCKGTAGVYAIYCSRHKCKTCPNPKESRATQCADCKANAPV